MRPLELELEGFTSFRNRTTCSFEGLDLFAITGPTGSGKTSLLDALIFALYGQTPRLGREVNQLVSRGFKHMRVRLDFAVEERRYRVVRTRKVLPKSEQSQATLEEIEGGRPKFVAAKAGDVEDTITQLIGLDFDSFIRSVVLPQGEFDLFLKREPKERQRILHHLLRMGIYERVRELAQERENASRREREHLDHQLQDLAEATEEVLAASREAVVDLDGQAAALDASLRQIEQVDAQAAALIQELAKAVEARSEGERLGAERRAAEAKIETIAQRETASERSRAELEAKLAANPYDEASHLALEKSEAEARNLRDAESARTRAEAESKVAKKTMAQIEKKLTATEDECERAESLVTGAAKAAETARVTLDELAGRFGSPAQVAAQIGVEENRLRARTERKEKEAARTAASAETERNAKALAAALDEQAKTAAEQEEAKASYAAVQRAHAALALRNHLHRGEPCPVCEQPVARPPAKRKLADLDRVRTALEEATHRASTCVQKAASLAARLEAGRNRVKELERDLERLGEAEDSSAAKLESYLGAPPEARTRERLGLAQANFEQAEKALSETTAKQQAADRGAADARRRRDTVAAELATEKRASALHEERLAETDLTIAEVRARIAAVVGEAPDLVQALEHALAGSRRAKAEREAILKEMENEVRRRGADREEAAATRIVLAEIEKKRSRIADAGLRAERRAAEARALFVETATDLGIPLAESTTGEAERQAVVDRLMELRGARVKLEGTRALAAKQAERIAADIEKSTGLKRRSAEVKRHETIAHQLALDLMVSKFVAYLVEEALQVLAADASRHLGTSGVSFSLAVEGQDFVVIDHANLDEKRSVKTLSGGESFIASLELAFAFADGLADLAGSGSGAHAALESLFIDEGFGTLDAENLDAVTGAIEALLGRRRMVGIITHMPELAQRMPARIVVTKQGNSSQVQVESG